MNRTLLRFVMVMLLVSSATSLMAFEYEGIYYKVLNEDAKTCEVTGSSVSGKVEIPSIASDGYNSYSVVGIGDNAFDYSSLPTSIIISEGVKKIGNSAFKYCKSLISVEIPESVTEIGENAFSDCKSLVSINIPGGITEIKDYTFLWCESLASISIPSSVKRIGEGAFMSCGLSTLTIPMGVKEIGTLAFACSLSLTSVDISNSVTSIKDGAFAGCTSLTSVAIPGSVIEIGEQAFWQSSLKSITIPGSVIEIGEQAFCECPLLASVVIMDGVNIIGRLAFGMCPSLESVVIPGSVKEIRNRAFYRCMALKSVNIPEGVSLIGEWAFYQCSSLSTVTIPNSVVLIEDWPFEYCSSLSTINYTARQPKEFNTTAFSASICNNATLYVRKECIDVVKELIPWKDFSRIIPLETQAESITLDNTDITLFTGERVRLNATISPDDTSDKTIHWRSSDSNIASVEDGIVTALKAGITTITAMTSNGLEASCEVTVIQNAESITLDTKLMELNVGESKAIIATVYPEDTSDKTVRWKSSNESVASVDRYGNVTGITEGTAIVTATCDEVSASCKVTVIDISGIDSVEADVEYQVYNLQGVLVKKNCRGDELNSLPSGIYIVVSNGYRHKIKI